MAYSPVEQGRLLEHPALVEVASRRSITPARAALAWVLRSDGMIAMPRAGSREHVRDNAAALEVQLDADDHQLLDQAFLPPRAHRPLEVL
jgi:diketogulonate reductase-like aldo/keto reductase